MSLNKSVYFYYPILTPVGEDVSIINDLYGEVTRNNIVSTSSLIYDDTILRDTYSQRIQPTENGEGFPNTDHPYVILGEHDGLVLATDKSDTKIPFVSGTYGIASIPTDYSLYNSSVISATLYLRANAISNHSATVESLIRVEADTNYGDDPFMALLTVDRIAVLDETTNLYSYPGYISGSITNGLNNIDITSFVKDITYQSFWNTGLNLAITVVPTTGNVGALVIDTEESYIRFNYNPVLALEPRNVVGDPGYQLINLTWDIPLDDGEAAIIQYRVEYAVQTDENDSSLTEWQLAGISNSTSLTIENLSNNKLYVFRVAAENSVGLGPYSLHSIAIQPSKADAPTASNTFNDANHARIRLRRDTAVNWSGTNPVLGLGEPGFETDTNLIKIGNNSSGWNQLPYVKVDNDSIVFPTDRDVNLVIGDSKINADSPRISMNLSQNEKFNVVAEKGIDLDYSSTYNSLVFSLDKTFTPFKSGELHSPYSRGLAGNVNYTDDHMYICTDTNFWKRIDLDKSKWFDPESIAVSLDSGSYPSVTEIYFSGFNAIISTDGDPFPAKASNNLTNDGITLRSDFFNAYQLTDQNYSFSFRYRGGKNVASSESAVSGFNGMLANGVMFAAPRAGTESVGIYTPPTGFHYNRSHFATHFKMDDCGGYVNFERVYAYYDGKFLTRCWNDPLVYNNNPYYSGSNYNGDYYRHTNGHSKMLGFCFDGYPVYGPFGYSDSDDATSPCSLMTSSYIAKTGDSHRPDNWKYTNSISVNDVAYNLTAGAFVEDFHYAEGSGILDQYNGRYAITPEYPEGTYAYYLTFTSDSLLVPKYPYIIGNFSKNKKVKQDLESSLLPISVDGYFPLFTSTSSAENYGLLNGGDGTYETLVVLGNTYYRPDGVGNATNPAAPTDISLSENRISEKATIGSIIGTLITTDANTNDNHIYSLVTGDSADDNGNFSIYNNELRVNSILSADIQPTHSIRIRTTDETNRFFEKVFSLSVVSGASLTSLSIVSGITSLLAGSGHTFGSAIEGTATDVIYSWSNIGSAYAYGVTSSNSGFYRIDSTNVQQRNDETVNVYLTAQSLSAFNTLTATSSFLLDHSEDPICLAGYYPLYASENDAIRDPNGNGEAHMHTVQGVLYWMPNGLSEDYHGSFDCDSLAPSKTDVCLDGSIDVTIANTGDGNRFVFDGNSSNTHRFKATTGTYVFNNVPSNHPIAFHNNGKPIAYSGTTSIGTKTALDGNTYTFYYGSVTGIFIGNFTTTSYECYYHGYMGGQDNFIYDNTCTSPTPTLTSTTISSLSSVNGGSSIELTSSKAGTATDVTYAWSGTTTTGASLSSTTGSSINLNTTDLDQDADQTIDITLTATSLAASTSVTDSKTITIVQSSDSSAPTLTAVIISSATTTNGGSSVTLNATPTGTATDVTYSWSVTSATGVSLSSTTGSSVTLNTTDLDTDTDQSIIVSVTASSVSASASVSDTQTIIIYQSADGGGGGGYG